MFDKLLGDLELRGFQLSNRLKEYTLFDDHLEQDRGWAHEIACETCRESDSCPFNETYMG